MKKKVIVSFIFVVIATILFSFSTSAAWLDSNAPTLKQGATGEYVVQLQKDLNILGYGLSTDGSFGPATLKAVKDYQSQMELEVDGSVGPATRSSIINTVNSYESSTSIQIPGSKAIVKGNTGFRVRFLQKMLGILGYSVSIDGSFGNETYNAVKKFQEDYGIGIDGSCGAETIRYINGAILGTYKPIVKETEPVTTEATTTTSTTSSSSSDTSPIIITDSDDDTTQPVSIPQISSGGALVKGSRGDRVKELQICLNYLKWNLSVDGSFGDKTLKAVKEFQKLYDLTVDGSCGSITIARINKACAEYDIRYDGNDPFVNTAEVTTSTTTTARNDTVKYATSMDTTKESKECYVGNTIKLSVIVKPTNTTLWKPIKWTTSDSTIASVDENGNLKGIKAGTTTAIAVYEAQNGSIYRKYWTITVKDYNATSIKITYTSFEGISKNILPLGSSIDLKYVLTPSNATSSVSWSTSDSKYITVDKNGKIKAIKESGNKYITLTAKTSNGKKASAKFKVVKYSPTRAC